MTLRDMPERIERARQMGLANRRHGRSFTTEYNIWVGMRRRCAYEKHPHYARYGGRGIAVCDRWRDSFEHFLADMGTRPSPLHTLDRKDNDGDYTPDNCRWATQAEQHNNTSTNRVIEHEGKRLTTAQWARQAGIEPRTLRARLRRGWPMAKALSPLTPNYGDHLRGKARNRSGQAA